MKTSKRLADKMEAYLQAMTEADEFCGAVLVAQKGEVLLSGDVQPNDPIRVEMPPEPHQPLKSV